MIILKINGTDRSSLVVRDSLEINQILTSQVDTAVFLLRKYGSRTVVPNVGDDVGIYQDTTKIFGGTITTVNESEISSADGLVYEVRVTDYTFLLDSKLVSETYSSQTIAYIINDLITKYASGFTSVNVSSTFTITKIVFNQVPISQCIKRLADVLRYDWYVDENKDIHFFSKFTNSAPYNLTDTSGNYVNETLERTIDGTQIANTVKVRGGEYDGATYTDKITVNGSNSKTFVLPYKFSNLTITVNGVSKTVGIDNIDSFPAKDVLYNFTEKIIRFNAVLTDGDQIQFSGNPKVPVLAIASDPASIALYGVKEKLIRDTTIQDLSVARKRAGAEVDTFKDPISNLKFDTYTAGLRTGMVINLTSTNRSTNTDFIISTVNFKARTLNDFTYSVEVVTTRQFGLIELLQQLLLPDPQQADDAEVAETIKTDTAEVTIDELITTVSPYQDFVTITLTESILRDPLGAGVSPTWVLGNYTPTSQSDTKRMGRLDYSLKVY
jgi:hypothetical protein